MKRRILTILLAIAFLAYLAAAIVLTVLSNPMEQIIR